MFNAFFSDQKVLMQWLVMKVCGVILTEPAGDASQSRLKGIVLGPEKEEDGDEEEECVCVCGCDAAAGFIRRLILQPSLRCNGQQRLQYDRFRYTHFSSS
jgi:hypothetical protein